MLAAFTFGVEPPQVRADEVRLKSLSDTDTTSYTSTWGNLPNAQYYRMDEAGMQRKINYNYGLGYTNAYGYSIKTDYKFNVPPGDGDGNSASFSNTNSTACPWDGTGLGMGVINWVELTLNTAWTNVIPADPTVFTSVDTTNALPPISTTASIPGAPYRGADYTATTVTEDALQGHSMTVSNRRTHLGARRAG